MANDVLSMEPGTTGCSVGVLLGAFVTGATVGAIAALLLAPQPGPESRRQLAEYGRRTGERMSEWAGKASAIFGKDRGGEARSMPDGEAGHAWHETEHTEPAHALAR